MIEVCSWCVCVCVFCGVCAVPYVCFVCVHVVMCYFYVSCVYNVVCARSVYKNFSPKMSAKHVVDRLDCDRKHDFSHIFAISCLFSAKFLEKSGFHSQSSPSTTHVALVMRKIFSVKVVSRCRLPNEKNRERKACPNTKQSQFVFFFSRI